MDVFLQEYFVSLSPLPIILFVIGLLLMICEMCTPGLGITGILGTISLIACVILAAAGSGKMAFLYALFTLAIILVLLLIAAIIVFRSFKKGALSRSPIILNDSISSNSSSLSGKDMQSLIGRDGICLTALRPAGNANFDGLKLDVVSDGSFIAKGARVRIVAIEGLRISVVEASDKQ